MTLPVQVDLSRGVRLPAWAITGASFTLVLVGLGFGLGIAYRADSGREVAERQEINSLREAVLQLREEVKMGKIEAHDAYCRLQNLLVSHVVKTGARAPDEVIPVDLSCPPLKETHIR